MCAINILVMCVQRIHWIQLSNWNEYDAETSHWWSPSNSFYLKVKRIFFISAKIVNTTATVCDDSISDRNAFNANVMLQLLLSIFFVNESMHDIQFHDYEHWLQTDSIGSSYAQLKSNTRAFRINPLEKLSFHLKCRTLMFSL